MEHQNYIKLLCSFGPLSQILPYYGYLHEGYHLLCNLHPLTKSTLLSYLGELSHSHFARSPLKLIYCTNRDYILISELLPLVQNWPVLVRIFDLPPVTFEREREVEDFFEVCEGVGVDYVRFTKVWFQNGKVKYKALKLFGSLRSLVRGSLWNSRAMDRILKIGYGKCEWMSRMWCVNHIIIEISSYNELMKDQVNDFIDEESEKFLDCERLEFHCDTSVILAE